MEPLPHKHHSTDLGYIDHELRELKSQLKQKHATKPFQDSNRSLKGKKRKQSLGTLHQSSFNSYASLPQWSWADKVDVFGAAPGSYNLGNGIGDKTTVSNKRTSPSMSFYRSDRGKGSMAVDSPACNHYSPKPINSARTMTFGNSSQGRLKQYSSIFKRSPGPIYFPKSQATGPAITVSARNTSSSFFSSQSPSSHDYRPENTKINRRQAPQFKFGTTQRGGAAKEFRKNTERYLKGQAGPGYVYDPVPVKSQRACILGTAGHQPLLSKFHLAGNLQSPGVGVYNPKDLRSGGKKYTMSRAPRKIDVKNCNLYSDGMAHEIFR